MAEGLQGLPLQSQFCWKEGSHVFDTQINAPQAPVLADDTDIFIGWMKKLKHREKTSVLYWVGGSARSLVPCSNHCLSLGFGLHLSL